MKKHKKILTIIIHAAVWGCFFLLPYIFRPQGRDISANISNRFIAIFTTNGIYLVAFYYFNTLVLLPKLLFQKKWLWYAASIIGCLVVFMYVPREIANIIVPPEEFAFKLEAFKQQQHNHLIDTAKQWQQMRSRGGMRGGSRFIFFPSSNAIFFLVFLISTCISVTQQWLKSEQTKKEVETEKLNTELSFLKSQVNPHFFFNTLNNIYALAVVGSPKTAPAIMKLSSIMRYILTDTQSDTVPLENEVNFINNFIDLQRVRLTDKVVVAFITEGTIANQQIAPLLFIPFVENAFKYGVSTKENSVISITIKATETTVHLYTTNTIVKADNGILDTTGIGINNVKRRLDLLYPHKHNLVITNNDNQFFVTLDISIK
ncbi:MAG: sensor histidine kinase [Flavobacterium sp.]|nr:sensor histidine kinase [Flavobacterium sp.]